MDGMTSRQQWIEATITFVRSAFVPDADEATKREAASVLRSVAAMLDGGGPVAAAPAAAAAAAAPAASAAPPPPQSADPLDRLISTLQAKLDDRQGSYLPNTGMWPWPQQRQ
jgi:hypothetical protein